MKLAHDREFQGAYGTQNRNVFDIHEDSSTGATQQLPAGVEFRKKSNIVMFKNRIYQLINIIVLKLFFYIILITSLSIFLYNSYYQNKNSQIKLKEASAILADMEYKIDIISARPDLLYRANNILDELSKKPKDVEYISKIKIDDKISKIKDKYKNNSLRTSFSPLYAKEDSRLKALVSLRITYIKLQYLTNSFENFINIAGDIYQDLFPTLQVLNLFCIKDQVLNSQNIDSFLQGKTPNFISADVNFSLNEIRIE